MGVEFARKHTANEIARVLSGCRSAIGQFSFKICAPIRRLLHVVTISVTRRRKREKCQSTRTRIVLKTESFFLRLNQSCRFSKNGPQSGVFPCKRRLIRDLSECTQQDGRKKRTTKRLCVTNVTGLSLACFVVIFT